LDKPNGYLVTGCAIVTLYSLTLDKESHTFLEHIKGFLALAFISLFLTLPALVVNLLVFFLAGRKLKAPTLRILMLLPLIIQCVFMVVVSSEDAMLKPTDYLFFIIPLGFFIFFHRIEKKTNETIST